MNPKNTHKKGSSRNLRLGVAGLVSAFAVIGSTLGVAATPAFAASPMPVSILNSGLMVDGSAAGTSVSGPDFSYTPAGASMARNVAVTMGFVAPNTTVTFSWRDETSGGSWQQGPVSTSVAEQGLPSYNLASAVMTNIPASTCGHTLQLEAAGETGVYGTAGPNYSTLYPVTTPPTTIVESCGPALWLTESSGTATGVAGDGFTPGGQVTVSGSGPQLSPEHCITLMNRTTCVAWPWNDSVTATTTTFRLNCTTVGGPRCYTSVAQPGGDISVTFPNPIQLCSGNVNNYSAVDVSTDLSATGSAGNTCLE
jgi:hypothetical protein